MSNSTNANQQELLAGKQAAQKLQTSIRSVLGIETIRTTGALMRTNAKAIADKFSGELDRITITSPHYGFKLNHGFEGVKSNNVAMRLTATNHLYIAIERTHILEDLADKIGNIRADLVTAEINF